MTNEKLIYIVIRQYKGHTPFICSVHKILAGAKQELQKQVDYGNGISQAYNATWNSPSQVTLYEDGQQWESYHIKAKPYKV